MVFKIHAKMQTFRISLLPLKERNYTVFHDLQNDRQYKYNIRETYYTDNPSNVKMLYTVAFEREFRDLGEDNDQEPG